MTHGQFKDQILIQTIKKFFNCEINCHLNIWFPILGEECIVINDNIEYTAWTVCNHLEIHHGHTTMIFASSLLYNFVELLRSYISVCCLTLMIMALKNVFHPL